MRQWIEEDYRRVQAAARAGLAHPDPDFEGIDIGDVRIPKGARIVDIQWSNDLDGIAITWTMDAEPWIDRVARGEGCA